MQSILQVIAGLSFVLVMLASLMVGGRMLLLARKTRALPELSLGLSLVLVFGVGYPAAVVQQQGEFSPVVHYGLRVVSGITVNTAFSMLLIFTWRVFRPRATWARLLAWGGVLFLIVRTIQGLTSFTMPRIDGVRVIINMLPVVVGYLWTAVESFNYYGRVRRQLAIGLSDPVTCNRFLIWALFGTFSTVATVAVIVMAGLGIDLIASPVATVVITLTGIGQSTCLFLAFLPPKAYLNRIRGAVNAPQAA